MELIKYGAYFYRCQSLLRLDLLETWSGSSGTLFIACCQSLLRLDLLETSRNYRSYKFLYTDELPITIKIGFVGNKPLPKIKITTAQVANHY